MPRSPHKRYRRSSSSSSSSSSNSRSRVRRRNWSPVRDRRVRRSRSRDSGRRRSRSRDLSRRRRSSVSPVPDRPIASEDPKYLNARIFVGHLPSDRVDKDELDKHFAIYGTILDTSVHPRGYGFVQFVREDDAKKAVEKEQRSLIKGSIIDVKMAAEGRRDRVMIRERIRGSSPYADRPPSYPPRDRERDPAPRGPPARDRSPVRDPYEDRFRDPYREPRDPARPPPPPPPREGREPYFDDPYRRPPPPDPYYDRYRDDPYRREREPYPADPYRDPYRDPFYEPPPRKAPPAECVVVLMKAQLRAYGESIERKVKTLNVIADSVVIPEDKTLAQQIEDISRHGGLFAIVVNSQNELHHSLTLNILHGSPQEHRNMPIEDAMTLIGRSFEKYLQSLKEKAGAVTGAAPPPAAAPAAAPAGRTAPFFPPSKDVSYLLNLLADNRQLTLEELDKVILYLRERRDKMMEAERRPIAGGDGGYLDPIAGGQSEEGLLQQQQQQELQTKILSILNGSGQPTPGVTSAGGPPSHLSSHGQPPPVAPASGGGGVNTALINFDNPSVQKALDNLIQSGPNLLRNINAASTAQTPGSMTGPSMARDAAGRPGLLSTPPGGPRQGYPPQGMGAAPPMRGIPASRPRYN